MDGITIDQSADEPDRAEHTPGPNERRVARQYERLGVLAGCGTDVACAVAYRTKSDPGSVTTDELCGLSLAFTRVAKAIRQIFALEQEMMGLRTMQGERSALDIQQIARNRETVVSSDDDSSVDDSGEGDDLGALHGAMNDLNDLLDRADLYDYEDYGDYDCGSTEEILDRIQSTLERVASQIRSIETEADSDESDNNDSGPDNSDPGESGPEGRSPDATTLRRARQISHSHDPP